MSPFHYQLVFPVIASVQLNFDHFVLSYPTFSQVFTPLLASTCVGTLEFRSVAEPIRSIQPAVGKLPDSYFFLAKATAIDEKKHEVTAAPFVPPHTQN